MKLKLFALIAGLLALAFAAPSFAADAVVPNYCEQSGTCRAGIGVTILGSLSGGTAAPLSTPANGTVAVANTFQSILAQNTARKGCTLQAGANPLLVWPGTAGSAVAASALTVGAYGTLNCGSGLTSIGDELSITATSLPATYVLWVQ